MPDANTTASSAVETQQAVTTPAQDANLTAVASSTTDDAGASQQGAKQEAAQAAKPTSLLDAMKAAVKPAEAKPDSPPDKAQSQSADPKSQGEEGDDTPPPFHQHPRWKAMVTRNKKLEAELVVTTEKAQAFDRLQSMSRQANLSAEEVDAGFNIMALMKSDPFKAKAMLQPYWSALMAATGEELPQDIRAKVEQGLLPEAEARELARTRATAATAQSQVRQTQEQQQQATLTEIGRSITDWEKAWQSSDPDYAVKKQWVEDRVVALLQSNPPRTAQDAVKLANQAKAEVEDRMKALRPQRTSVAPPPPAASSVKTAPKPATMLDAMRQAAGGSK